MSKGNFSNPPVKAGEEIEVEIISKGSKGDGVAKYQGFIIFIPDANVGEKHKVRVTRVLANMGFAEIIKEEVDKNG